MMEDEVQELLSTLLKSNRIVIKNQAALEDKFSDMCDDLSKALSSISNAMHTMGGDTESKEKEEQSHESGTITYS